MTSALLLNCNQSCICISSHKCKQSCARSRVYSSLTYVFCKFLVYREDSGIQGNEIFQMTMPTVRLINALLGINKCGECVGCRLQPCSDCWSCFNNKICLETVCVWYLSALQRKSLGIKSAFLKKPHRLRGDIRYSLLTWLELTAT